MGMYNKKILSMDLSMNLPAMALLSITEDKKIKVLGYEYVDNKGLTGKRKKTNAQKLVEIHNALNDFISKFGLKSCEDLHIVRERGFSRFATETQTIFRVVGLVDYICLDQLGNKDIMEITPPSVKKLVTGDGKASKSEVMDEVRNFLVEDQRNMKFYSDDVSDAIAVGIAYAIKQGLLI